MTIATMFFSIIIGVHFVVAASSNGTRSGPECPPDATIVNGKCTVVGPNFPSEPSHKKSKGEPQQQPLGDQMFTCPTGEIINLTNGEQCPLPSSGGSSGGGSGTITVGPIATKHAMLQCVHGNITSLAQEISINASQVSNETMLNQFGNSTLRCMATPHYMSIPGPMSR